MSDAERSTSRRVVATTLADAHAGPSFHTEMVTQLTNGVEVDVLAEEGEWCRVRQRDGYESWVYAAYLASDAAPPTATHIVPEPTLLLYPTPDAEPDMPVGRLPIGTNVAVVDQSGDWSYVRPAGNQIPDGWAYTAFLRPLASLPLIGDPARAQIAADARRVMGVYYLWGGCTAWGIDCSGLSQLCHRLAGHTLLRDARMQFTQGRPVDPPLRPGDLLFFHGESDRAKITHVGISTGGWQMIHSSRLRNGVYEEDLDAGDDVPRELRARFAGARSILD